MKIETIDTGFFYADGGAMFGAVPKRAWVRRYPADETNGCVMAMRSLLITTDEGRIILVDTGAGNKHLRALSYYRFFDLVDLPQALNQRGIRPEQVTDLILTHLHFDHCGDATRYQENGDLALTFPNARHWVSRAQWDNFRAPHALEKASYLPENMLPVHQAGLLQLISEETSIAPGVDIQLYDGHSPGQLVPYIHSAEQTFVFPGDVIPLAASLSPEWISAYDTHPLTSYTEKLRLLEQAAAHNQCLIFCHDAYTPYTAVKKVGRGFKAHFFSPNSSCCFSTSFSL